MFRIVSNDLIIAAKLLGIYDSTQIHSSKILVEEMLAPLRLRAGVSLKDIFAKEAMPLPYIFQNLSKKLTDLLDSHISVDVLSFLCSTIDLDTDKKPQIFYLHDLNLMQHYQGDNLTICVEAHKTSLIVRDKEDSFIEVIEAKDSQALLEGICEFIEFYRYADKRKVLKD